MSQSEERSSPEPGPVASGSGQWGRLPGVKAFAYRIPTVHCREAELADPGAPMCLWVIPQEVLSS